MKLQDISLQETLENMDWTLHDHNGEAHEFCKIPKDNPLLAMILAALPYAIGQLGEYSYKHESNFIKRQSPLIVSKTFKNTKYRVEKISKGVTPL